MINLKFKNLRYVEWGLFIIILILILFGLIIIYSLDLSQDNNFLFFKKQLIFACLGIVVFFIFNSINYKILKTYSYWFYLFALSLLSLVLLFGKTVHGTKGWFVFFGFQFQPVEIAKLFLILVLARFFAFRAYEIKKIQTIILSGVLFVPSFLLVMFQPDLGSAIVLFMIWFGMILVSGVKKKHLMIIFLILLVVFVLAWFFGFEDYQKARIETFLNPTSDPLGAGYNVLQSTIAVGSGQIFGRGVSLGSQSQLNFLPEAHTDFIFSSLAEASGFLGAGLVLFLYALIFFRVIRRLKSTRGDFAIFLVAGILIYFISQIVLNIAMNLGIAPVMGLPLPFLSYGGSSMVVSLMMFGIVSHVVAKT